MEKIIYRNIRDGPLKLRSLHENQHVCMIGKSTDSAPTRWYADQCLLVNPVKTVLVAFTRKRNLGQDGSITMFDKSHPGE